MPGSPPPPRSATDSLVSLHKPRTNPPDPLALSPTTSASSQAAPRGRSHTVLPKLSTAVSAHLPWRTASPPRGAPRHGPGQSVAVGPGRPHLHLGKRPSTAAAPTPAGVGAVAAAEAPVERVSSRLARAEPALDAALAEWARREERERRRTEARSAEISGVYQRLTDVSARSATRLDEVCYSILEKMNVLKATVAGLAEICDQARSLSGHFESDARSMQREVQEHADTFDGSGSRRGRVGALEERLKRGREKMDSLSGRLESAKSRVRALEKREAEVQESISFRLRIMYVIVVAAAVFFLSVFIMNLFSPPTKQPKESLKLSNTSELRLRQWYDRIKTCPKKTMPIHTTEEPGPVEDPNWVDRV